MENPSAQTAVETKRDTVRVNVNFSRRAFETLQSLAYDEGKSMSVVLRDAIALKIWFKNTQKDARILVDRDGKIHEVLRV